MKDIFRSRDEKIEELAMKVEKNREMENAKYALRPLLLNQPNQYGLIPILRSKFKSSVRKVRLYVNHALIKIELS